MSLEVGQRVSVREDTGTIKYYGTTSFSAGQWVGIQLDLPSGKNNGSVQGIEYFTCDKAGDNELYGLFVRPGVVKPMDMSNITTRSRSPPKSPMRSHPIRSPSAMGSPSPSSPTRLGFRTSSALGGTRPSLSSMPPPDLKPQSRNLSGELRSPLQFTKQSRNGDMSDGTRSIVVTPEPSNQAELNIPKVRKSISPISKSKETPDSIENPNISLSRQIENLKLKLKVMEKKRIEDRDKIHQFQEEGKKSIRLENIVKRLQLKLTPMHEEVQSLRAKLVEVESANSKLVNEASKNDDAIEMATLDREMAEERSENLMLELDALRQKFEKLELECEILREENALYADEENKGTSSVGDEAEFLRLKKRNEKLETALLKLRKVYGSQEDSYKEKISSLETDLQQYNSLSDTYEQTLEKLNEAETIILDLRVQLDSALGAEDMIESLTEKNLELSEKCDELKNTIEELETLKELNDELENNHAFHEEQLSQELAALELMNKETKAKIEDIEERNAYLESVIVKFRDLVFSLDAELTALKSNDSAPRVNVQEFDDFKMSSVSITKTLELEIRKFESEQALRHLEMVKCYLSDDFTIDSASIGVLLGLDRIAFVATVMVSYFKDMLSYNFSVNTNICISLIELRRIASTLADAVRYSSDEEFRKMSSTSEEVYFIINLLQRTVEQIKKEELVEVEFAKGLNVALLKIRRLEDTIQLSNEIAQISNRDLLTEVQIYIDVVVEIGKTLTMADSNEAIKKLMSDVAGIQKLKISTSATLEQLKIDKVALVLVKSDYNRLHEACEKLQDLVKLLSQGFSASTETSSAETMSPAVEIMRQTEVKDLVASIFEKIKEVSISNATKVNVPSSPWITMAQQMKQLKLEDRTRDRDIEVLRQQEQRVLTMLRTKEKKIEELDVTIETLNSRLVKSKDQDKVIFDLKKSLADSIAQEKQFRNDLEKLKKSMEQQDKQLSNYKEQIAATSKRVVSNEVVTPGSSLHQELISLRSAISYLSKKETADYDASALWLKPMNYTDNPNKARVKCHTLFRGLRQAVTDFNAVKLHIPESTLWRSRQGSKLEYLAQSEQMEKFKSQISDLVL